MIEQAIQQEQSIKPGVYDISIEDYHGGDGISRSSLMKFRKTPYHYWYNKNNPEERESPDIIKKIHPLEFGNAVHTFILENETFFERYTVMEPVNRATKQGKSQFAEMKEVASTNNRQIICQSAFDELLAIKQAIDVNDDAKALISDALYERSIYWNDPATGLLCKVRPDIWHGNFIVDLKTCADASYSAFQRAIMAHGYHIQAGMIHEALKNVTQEDIKTFIYVAIEKEAPYAVAVYQLDEMALAHGATLFKRNLREIKQCIDANTWPSYPTATISLPSYAYSL